MKVEVSLPINSTKEQIWNKITDIENLANTIEGIQKVEVLERPQGQFVGTKWTETRKMFGKEASETMWIAEAEENKYYRTLAESHGTKYDSITRIVEKEDGCELCMEFTAKPQTLGSKIVANTIGRLFIGATKKAFLSDFNDIKKELEK